MLASLSSLLLVNPNTVAPDGVFSVTNNNGTPLPPKVICSISSEGNVLQWNIVDVSGTVELDLKEKYGALQLEACDDLICEYEMAFTSDLINVGTDVMNITFAIHELDGQVESFLEELKRNNVLPEYQIEVDKTDFYIEGGFRFDACKRSTFSYGIFGEGNPTDGRGCEDRANFTLSVLPQCDITMELECTSLQSGVPCDDISVPELYECDCVVPDNQQASFAKRLQF